MVNDLETVILMLVLICHTSMCNTEPLMITREAMAIASCESGDGHNYGTFTVRARSETSDGGLWQFNDKTYLLIAGRTHADVDDPAVQYKMFKRLWRDGRGWKHWKASQLCWSQWMTINDEGVAVWQ